MKAVRCETQENWDFVNKKLRKEDLHLPSNYWDTYKELTCKNLTRKTYGSVKCYGESTLYSFNDWCKENNYLEIIEEIIVEDLSYLKLLFKKLNIK